VCFHLNGVESPVNLLRGRVGSGRESERESEWEREGERECVFIRMGSSPL